MSLPLNHDDFATAYVANGGNATKAAIAAGYSPTSARQQAYKLTRNATVQRLIREEQQRVIGGRLCSKALQVLEQIMDDPEAPVGARVDACKTILDRGGIPAIPAAMVAGGQLIEGKPVQAMSRDELMEFIARGSAELERIRAKSSPGAELLTTFE